MKNSKQVIEFLKSKGYDWKQRGIFACLIVPGNIQMLDHDIDIRKLMTEFEKYLLENKE